MLRTAKADALSAKGLRGAGLIGLIRISTHTKPAHFVRPFHEPGVLLIDARLFSLSANEYLQYLRWTCLNFSLDDFPGASVNREPIALVQNCFPYAHHAGSVVDGQRLTPGYTNLSHLPRNQSRVGCHPASSSKNSLCCLHPTDIVGAGLSAAQHYLFAAFLPCHGVLCVKDNPSRGRPRSSRQSFRENPSLFGRLFFVFVVEDRT